MAGSILGKRSRSDLNGKSEVEEGTSQLPCSPNTEGPAVSTRSKRQSLRSSTHNDENQPPAQLSEDDEIHVSTTRKARKQPSKHTVPAKHGAPERHINASPIRINGHFRETKPPVQLYADSKDARTPRTPSTPRHRDALAKKIPVTPKHRVLLNNSPSARAFTSPSSASTSVYNSARRLFSRCCNPGKLVGRDAERAEISAFVEKRTESRTGGCLYVSGPPGTGKSALIAEVCANFSQSRQSVVNCMSVRTIKDLSQKLSNDLSLPEGEGLEHLRSCFSTVGQTKEQYLVILDEVDRLLELDLELFYRIFEWSMTPESNLILLGIANALDLTDRFLPQLKARGLKPELLPFLPYSAKQIADILTTKLKTLTTADSPDLPFLHPAAIQFCARKVASQTGDLRKAFDICRRAIDLVEQEAREKAIEESLQASPTKTPLMENINLSSPVTPRASPHKARHIVRYTVDNAPKVTIAHVAKVTAQAFGNGALQRLATLNLQQKAVLCALAALEKKRRETQVERDIYSTPSKADVNHSAPTIKHLFEAYSSLCKRDQILHPLTSVEFRDVVSGLETSSLVSPADAKNGTLGAMPPTPSRTPGRRSKMASFGGTSAGSDERRVASVVSYKELSDSLDGAGSDLLRSILNGHGLSM